MSLSKGEIGLIKTFVEDIGGRDLTLDYRYDGEGWFQVWADDQILFSDSAFSQQQITVNIPTFAKSLRFVLGAVDGSRVHEVTLFDLVLSAPTVQDDGGSSPLE